MKNSAINIQVYCLSNDSKFNVLVVGKKKTTSRCLYAKLTVLVCVTPASSALLFGNLLWKVTYLKLWSVLGKAIYPSRNHVLIQCLISVNLKNIYADLVRAKNN